MTRENQQTTRVFSASELDRRAGLNPYERRTLIRAGILSPARTGGGWAVFTAQDVETARAWKARAKSA